MTISEQVQNDYTVAWQVIGPMARQLSLGELVQPSGTWLNDDMFDEVGHTTYQSNCD